MKVPGILKNKYVYYALVVLAVLNVVGYVSVQAWECLALFALTACCANSYCKDRSCAILAALFVSNFVFGCGRVKEGIDETLKDSAEHMADAAASAAAAAEKERFKEGHETNPTADSCQAIADAAECAREGCTWDVSGNSCSLTT